ncbi:MAG: non-homologous end-joining DNA ligase [Rhizobiaceae bacterium]|nr:non-homologous end-joining DNA ligase [Rhizobiaceae bacterium]
MTGRADGWNSGGTPPFLKQSAPAGEVVREELVEQASPGKSAPGPARRDGAATTAALSHPDKVYWPRDKVTKRLLLDYYGSVWERMRPFVVDRPLALVRAPDGIGGQRFFQKHASPGMHGAVKCMRDPDGGEEILYIEDFDGLAALVQLGVLEIHVWGARIDAIETPDQIVFDLDPDEGVGIEAVREATDDVRARLEGLGLPTFLKTSGGKGFHVMVPLKPSADWLQAKGFAHDFARAMEQSDPDRYTATLSKKARKGRIFIDYLRNGRGSTTVVAYSVRARDGAAVSMPVDWSRLPKDAPSTYAIGSDALQAALKRDDPWTEFFTKGKSLKIGRG